jgi:molybdopterin synthase sulfur carrier subunit
MSEVPARRVKLLYFAWVREKVGCGAEEIELPEGLATVADVVGWLKTRGPQFDEAFARPELVRVALDRVHVKPAALIRSAREIAFFPPVTGG